LNYHWLLVTKEERGRGWKTFLRLIRNKIPAGQVWRHNQAGDLVPHPEDKLQICPHHLADLADNNTGRRGFTYTHYPVEGESSAEYSNRESIKWANKEGFTINLSGDNITHADKLKALDIAPVTTIVNSNETRKSFKSPAGNTIVICPAALDKNKNCADCKLCAIPTRKTIIGFPAHGFRTRQINQILE